jgi:hypothetical protein
MLNFDQCCMKLSVGKQPHTCLVSLLAIAFKPRDQQIILGSDPSQQNPITASVRLIDARRAEDLPYFESARSSADHPPSAGNPLTRGCIKTTYVAQYTQPDIMLIRHFAHLDSDTWGS